MSEKEIIPELGDLPDFLSKEPFLSSNDITKNEKYFKKKLDPRSNFLNSQKENTEQLGPTWKAVKLADLLSKEDLKTVKQSLESVKTTLSQIETLLTTVESVVEIIKQVEGAIQDIIGQILNSIISILESFLVNLKSTGVYFLDMTDYVAKTQNGSLFTKEPITEIDAQYKKDFRSANVRLNSDSINFDYASKTGGDEIELNEKRKEKFNVPWRRISYSEFIGAVANSFINKNDIFSKPIDEMKIESQKNIKDWDSLKADLKDIKLGDAEWKGSTSDLWTNPGAPKWGQNSSSFSMVVTLNIPDLNIVLEIVEEIEKFFKNWNLPEYDKIEDEEEANITNRKIQVPTSGPKWQGASLETILSSKFPPFRFLDSVISYLKSFKTSTKTITEVLSFIIKSIKKYIKKIRRLILIINLLIKLLESIERLSFNLLTIQSKDGVFDIYDQLLSATGYPGQEEDIEDTILGLVFAVGVPSPNISEYNFSDIFAESNRVVNQETQQVLDLFPNLEPSESGLKRFASFFK